MEKKGKIDMSVIVPVYNVEEYLPACIESLMHQSDLCLEIILVNDGSTDRSGIIADQYALRDSRIKVIHQKNRGLSAARNAGLELALGEYISFVDSDDWIKENSLYGLYREVSKYQADVVKGNISYSYQDETINSPYQSIPKEIQYIPFSGKEGYIRLMQSSAYIQMAWNYIYRRKYLEKIQARFEEGIIHEDELWTPVVLCLAEKVVFVDIDFYYYRQRDGSLTRVTNLQYRLNSLFRVTDKLFEFAGLFDFSGEDSDLKNWLYVTIFRIYAVSFRLLSMIKDSSYIVPEHQLERFWRDAWEMMPIPQKICRNFFQSAESGLKKYTDWRTSNWVASITSQVKAGKKLMLVFNIVPDEDLSLKIEDVPVDWVITTDRRYFQHANTVVFHLPCLYKELDNDIEKPEKQIWASLYLESEKDHALINNSEIGDIFDLWMLYSQEEGQKHPLINLCRKVDEIEHDHVKSE